ncbi:hypothetical protein BS47DRAFT_1362895 [Hydnum rufescens UP504]|uniref:Uncharacterized protein n=1 Tax=Hydnum rufescens UP504 TaxID=1448309 RepID=A0A9P6AWW5_9AGAM|nr:hypothetical protein BS47DRAFT_1362895 [Hydnum rufescens UP504]
MARDMSKDTREPPEIQNIPGPIPQFLPDHSGRDRKGNLRTTADRNPQREFGAVPKTPHGATRPSPEHTLPGAKLESQTTRDSARGRQGIPAVLPSNKESSEAGSEQPRTWQDAKRGELGPATRNLQLSSVLVHKAKLKFAPAFCDATGKGQLSLLPPTLPGRSARRTGKMFHTSLACLTDMEASLANGRLFNNCKTSHARQTCLRALGWVLVELGETIPTNASDYRKGIGVRPASKITSREDLLNRGNESAEESASF